MEFIKIKSFSPNTRKQKSTLTTKREMEKWTGEMTTLHNWYYSGWSLLLLIYKEQDEITAVISFDAVVIHSHWILPKNLGCRNISA